GLLGLSIPPGDGGFGGGADDMIGTMQAFGKALAMEPYLSTLGLGAQCIARSGSEAQKKNLLPAVVAGRLKLAFGATEKSTRFNLRQVSTRATKTRSGWVLDGEKWVVMDAPCADCLILSARTAGKDADAQGISLFLVQATAAGLNRNSYRTNDGFRAADLMLKEVKVGEEALLVNRDEALPLIEEVVDFATALLCAEAVGILGY